MGKVKMTAKVVSQQALTDDIFSMWIQADEIAGAAVPGQFISVYTKDAGKLLPRPISLCQVDKEKGQLRIVYRVVGAGTSQFSGRCHSSGQNIEKCIAAFLTCLSHQKHRIQSIDLVIEFRIYNAADIQNNDRLFKGSCHTLQVLTFEIRQIIVTNIISFTV